MEKGLCECGCGLETNVTPQAIKRLGLRKGEHYRFMPGHNNRGITGSLSASWQGGRRKNHGGYIMVHVPDHHRAGTNGYVFEHIVIAEKKLGKKLPPGCEVHHHGTKEENNKIVICQDHEYHALLHIRQRALDACGDANKRKCKFCQEYDFIENLYCRQYSGWIIYHHDCLRKSRRVKK